MWDLPVSPTSVRTHFKQVFTKYSHSFKLRVKFQSVSHTKLSKCFDRLNQTFFSNIAHVDHFMILQLFMIPSVRFNVPAYCSINCSYTTEKCCVFHKDISLSIILHYSVLLWEHYSSVGPDLCRLVQCRNVVYLWSIEAGVQWSHADRTRQTALSTAGFL